MNFLPVKLLLMILVCLPAAAQAQGLPEPARPSDNAAVWYLTAQLMLDTSDPDLIGTLTGRDDLPQDAAAKANAIQQLDESLRSIRRAASLDDCTWAVDLKADGPNALLRHLGYLRQQSKLLINVAWFNADRQGGQDQAIADALAVMRMSRHAAADGTLVGTLVQFSIDDKALTFLSGELHRLNRKQLEKLLADLDALPARRTIGAAVASEAQIVDWMRQQNKAGRLAGFVNQNRWPRDPSLVQALKGLDDKAKQQQLSAWLGEMDALYAKLARNMALPLDQSDKANAALDKQIAEGSNPLAKMMMPTLGKARQREVQARASRTILKAMIAYRLGGMDAFNKVTCPHDGKPFTFGKDDGHLTVNSRLINRHGVPVRLLFSQAAAKPLE